MISRNARLFFWLKTYGIVQYSTEGNQPYLSEQGL